MRLLLLFGLLAFLYGESDVSFSRRQDTRFNRGRGVSSLAGDPLSWPGASSLLAWWPKSFEATYSADMKQSGAGPLVSQSGTATPAANIVLKVSTAGPRGTAQMVWSTDNGATFSYGPFTTAVSVDLGNGVTLACGTGSDYVLNVLYERTFDAWPDATGHAHHWLPIDGTSAKRPTPGTTAYGTGLKFDGVSTCFQNATSLAATLIGGTDKPLYMIAVLAVDSVVPTDTNSSIIAFNDGVTNHAFIWFFTSTPLFRAAKQDNTDAVKTATGGTPATGAQILEIWSEDGQSFTMRRGGTALFTAGNLDLGDLTVSKATLGKTFNSGAEGNPIAATFLEMACYTSGLDTGTRNTLLGLYRGRFPGL